MLRIENLCFRYRKSGPGHTDVLKNITLESRVKGTFTGIIGPNGSGKTTLINILSRFYSPCAGSVLLDHTPLHEFSFHEYSRYAAYIPQETFYQFPYKVWEILLMARFPYRNRFSLHQGDHFDFLESILDQTDTRTLADRQVMELSGGEKQRVNVARALAQDTPILLADEPFSSMDMYYQLRFLNYLKQSAAEKGRGIFAVLHDLSMVDRFCDQVWLLDRGRLAGAGPREQVMDPALLESVFRIPLSRDKKGRLFIRYDDGCRE
jgi:iron complex transport system ATP-binding protein